MCGRFSISFAILASMTTFVSAGSIGATGTCDEQYIGEGIANCPKIVPREEWGAEEPTCYETMPLPVKYVVLHHTYIPTACDDRQSCIGAMRSMQAYHQKDRHWCDVGYNFAVGGDGYVYVGRGWSAVGAHAPPYNQNSIGITFIGDWQAVLPSPDMMNTVKALIKCGVNSGFIAKDYKLIGHRQAKTPTVCPGEALFKEIQTWPHWSDQWINLPASPSPEIKLIETNSAPIRSASGGEQEETRYKVGRLRRRRFLE